MSAPAASSSLPSLPTDLAAAHAMILSERTARIEAEAAASQAVAEALQAMAAASSTEAMIAHLTLQIAKLRRELYSSRSERKARLLDQLEMQLEEAETTAGEDPGPADDAASKTGSAPLDRRKRGARKPLPAHLIRERVVIPAPCTCMRCGSNRLRKLGEDITGIVEMIPRQWKVIETVREKFSCRDCERISQAPAPFHPTPRGLLGPNLLATILFEKYGQHQPLNRQSERYGREGIDLPLSTLADQVGACVVALRPLHALIEAHVFAAERLHGDDTPVPILAKGKTVTGRIWTYVRDDAPFGGPDPPAAVFYASGDREAVHAERHLEGYAGILQADAYAGYSRLYAADRLPAPLTQALCLSHARRKFFELADIAASALRRAGAAPISPIAFEAVKQIDALFDIEREINGHPSDERLAVRQDRAVPLLAKLEQWMRAERARLSRHAPVAKAMDYMLTRWDGFVRFTTDGRVCLTNNAAERALRGIALGRKSWLFAGSLRGAERCAAMLSLITTAKLNDVDPQAWLADVLGHIHDTPQSRLPELLPWAWNTARTEERAAA